MHFTLGLWIRNNWINNPLSPLGKEILKHECATGYDGYSSAIIIIYHRHLNGKELKIEEEIKEINWMTGLIPAVLKIPFKQKATTSSHRGFQMKVNNFKKVANLCL